MTANSNYRIKHELNTFINTRNFWEKLQILKLHSITSRLLGWYMSFNILHGVVQHQVDQTEFSAASFSHAKWTTLQQNVHNICSNWWIDLKKAAQEI